MLRGDGADKRKSLELLDVGRKRGRRRKRALPANIDRGVSLQIIASDRKKKNHLRNWAFPQPVDAQFLPLLLALDKTSRHPWRHLRALFRRQQIPSWIEVEFQNSTWSQTRCFSSKAIFFGFTTCKGQELGPEGGRDEAAQTVAGVQWEDGWCGLTPPPNTPQ